MSLGVSIITPLIKIKHSLQLKLASKQTLKSNKVGGKTCDCRMPQLLVSGESPHEAKNKSMVIYKLGDTPSHINHLLHEGEFSHILKQQIDTMCCTWILEQCAVPLHKHLAGSHIISCIICYDLHHILHANPSDEAIY